MPLDVTKLTPPPNRGGIDVTKLAPPPNRGRGRLPAGTTAPVMPLSAAAAVSTGQPQPTRIRPRGVGGYYGDSKLEKAGQVASQVVKAFLTSPDYPQSPEIDEKVAEYLAGRNPLSEGFTKGKLASNIGKSIVSGVQGTANFPFEAATHPWQSFRGIPPMMLTGLESVNPLDLERAAQIWYEEPETPIFAGLTALGAVKGGRGIVKGVREMRGKPAVEAGQPVGKQVPTPELAELPPAVEPPEVVTPGVKPAPVAEAAAKEPWEMTREEERGIHRPMTVEGGAARLYDLTPAFGEEIYSENAIRYFGTGEDILDNQTMKVLKSLRNRPEVDVTVYRAIPEDASLVKLRSGDWVTVNRKYAEQHGERTLDGKYKIIEEKVKAKDLTTNADSFHEQGYYPESLAEVPKVEPPKPLTPEVKTAAAKEPWEMTREEWMEHSQKMGEGRRTSVIYEDDQFHENWIRTRIKEGKPVPPEVLKDYPDLVKTAPEVPKAAAEVKGEIPQGGRVDFADSKPGDTLLDGSILVKRRIRNKAEAKRLAEEVGGIWMIDGENTWAVSKPKTVETITAETKAVVAEVGGDVPVVGETTPKPQVGSAEAIKAKPEEAAVVPTATVPEAAPAVGEPVTKPIKWKNIPENLDAETVQALRNNEYWEPKGAEWTVWETPEGKFVRRELKEKNLWWQAEKGKWKEGETVPPEELLTKTITDETPTVAAKEYHIEFRSDVPKRPYVIVDETGRVAGKATGGGGGEQIPYSFDSKEAAEKQLGKLQKSQTVAAPAGAGGGDIVEIPTKPPTEPIIQETAPTLEAAKGLPITTAEPQPEPKVVGLKKASITESRLEKGLEQIPDPAERQTFQGWLDQARESGLTNETDRIVREVKENPRELSPAEQMALLDRRTRLENDFDMEMSSASELAVKGDRGGVEHARMRAEIALRGIDELETASRIGGTESGRGLVKLKAMMETDRYSLAKIVQQVQANKGRKLTDGELSQLKELSDKHAQTQKELAELNLKYEDALKNQEKAIAEAVQKKIAEQSKRTARIKTAKESLFAERVDIKNKLAAMGFRLNDITGVTAEGSYLIGKLAINYIREGALTLEEVVTKVMHDIPEITEMDVYRGLNAKDPKRIKAARNEVQLRLQALKLEAGLLERIDKAQQGIFDNVRNPLQVSDRIKMLQKQLRDLRKSLYRTSTSPNRLERGIKTLNSLQDQLANQYRTLRKNKSANISVELAQIKEQIAELRHALRVDDNIGILTEQLRTGEFKVRPAKPQRSISPELERKEIELKRLRSEIRQRINESKPMTAYGSFVAGTDLLRTMKATADVSFWFRQGLILSAKRPLLFGKSATKSIHAVFSKYTAEQIDLGIRSAPHHYLREVSGLELAELRREGTLKSSEEMYRSDLAQKIPIYKHIVMASERNAVTFINLLRTAAFDEFLRKYPNATRAELRAWASWINDASMRANLGKFSAAAPALSVGIFAPRAAWSRIMVPVDLVKNMRNPRVRNMIAKDLVATAGLGMTVLGLAALFGHEVGNDLRESDLGKIKIGNTRYDIWAGMQQPVRLALRIGLKATDRMGITGKDLTEFEKEFDPLDAIMQFASYKVAPAVTMGRELFTGKSFGGQKTIILGTAARSIVPMTYEDIYDAWRSEGIGRTIPVGIFSPMGVSISTYEDSITRRRRDINKAIKSGDRDSAEQLQSEWNIDHPENPISSKFLDNAEAKKEFYKTATDQERKLMNLSEANRADFIFKELNSLPTANDKSIYLKQLREKDILTPKVFEQLKALQAKQNEGKNAKVRNLPRRPGTWAPPPPP